MGTPFISSLTMRARGGQVGSYSAMNAVARRLPSSQPRVAVGEHEAELLGLEAAHLQARQQGGPGFGALRRGMEDVEDLLVAVGGDAQGDEHGLLASSTRSR